MGAIPVTQYGNVDVRHGVPAGFVHVPAKRLTRTCAAVGVECAPALTGWKSGKWGGPKIFGVVVCAQDEAKVREAMRRRASKRLTPEQKEARRKATHQADAANFAERIRAAWPRMPENDILRCARHATEIGSGRVGRSSTAEDPVRAAVVAHARHNYTSYERNFEGGGDKDENRQAIGAELRAKLSEWEGT